MGNIVGERIKKIRNLRGMTQKQFAEAIGLPVESGDVRIAQYESGDRKAKKALTKAMAEALDVHELAISSPKIDTELQVIHTLFMIEDKYGMRVFDETMFDMACLSFKNKRLNQMVDAWQSMYEQYDMGSITQDEYDVWRYQYGGEPKRDEFDMI